jgi:hypothetical protein
VFGVVAAVVVDSVRSEVVEERGSNAVGLGLRESNEFPLRISREGLPSPISLADVAGRRESREARPRVARRVGEGVGVATAGKLLA